MATKVLTADLKVGMFVADLDRPWVDTPFLLQGFIIEDDEQIADLQRHCEFVIVDRARSVGDQFEAAPAVSAAPASAPRVKVAAGNAEDASAKQPPKPIEPPPPPSPGRSTPRLKMIRLEDVARSGGSRPAQPAPEEEDGSRTTT